MSERDLVPFHLWCQAEHDRMRGLSDALRAGEVQSMTALAEMAGTLATLLQVLGVDAADKLIPPTPKVGGIPHMKMYIFLHMPKSQTPYQGYAFGVTEEQARKDGSISDDATCIGWH